MSGYRSLTEPTLIYDEPVSRELPAPDGSLFGGLMGMLDNLRWDLVPNRPRPTMQEQLQAVLADESLTITVDRRPPDAHSPTQRA